MNANLLLHCNAEKARLLAGSLHLCDCVACSIRGLGQRESREHYAVRCGPCSVSVHSVGSNGDFVFGPEALSTSQAWMFFPLWHKL